MTKQKYQGRHRGQSSASVDGVVAVTSTTPDLVEGGEAGTTRQHRAPSPVLARPTTGSSGRHRAPSTHTVPRLAGTGILLPTAATATIVLTTTGAHLGAAPTPAPVVAAPAAASAAATTSDATAQADVLESKGRLLELRTTPDRAARSTERTPAPSTTSSSSAATAPTRAQLAARAQAALDAKEAAQLAAAHRWVTPLDVRYTLTSGFGMRWGSMHPGQDFAVPVGSPIKAMSSGTVIFAGWSGGYGNKVEIRYWDGTISWYAHNSRLKVEVGDLVTPGEIVALSGNTGHSTGPHSHIEIHLGGDDTGASAVPPIPWLTKHANMPGRNTGQSKTATD